MGLSHSLCGCSIGFVPASIQVTGEVEEPEQIDFSPGSGSQKMVNTSEKA